MRKEVFLLVLVLWAGAGKAFAHGVGFRRSALPAVALEFMYSTGEMMSYREARVFSPNDDKFAVQTGRTDEKGRFAFVPDVPGEWRVIVRDEEGHQCEARVGVSGEGLGVSGEGLGVREENSQPEMLVRALLGVSILMNIAILVKHYAHK